MKSGSSVRFVRQKHVQHKYERQPSWLCRERVAAAEHASCVFIALNLFRGSCLGTRCQEAPGSYGIAANSAESSALQSARVDRPAQPSNSVRTEQLDQSSKSSRDDIDDSGLCFRHGTDLCATSNDGASALNCQEGSSTNLLCCSDSLNKVRLE